MLTKTSLASGRRSSHRRRRVVAVRPDRSPVDVARTRSSRRRSASSVHRWRKAFRTPTAVSTKAARSVAFRPCPDAFYNESDERGDRSTAIGRTRSSAAIDPRASKRRRTSSMRRPAFDMSWSRVGGTALKAGDGDPQDLPSDAGSASAGMCVSAVAPGCSPTLVIAAAQFAEPVLFGRIIDTAGPRRRRARTGRRSTFCRCWSPPGSCFGHRSRSSPTVLVVPPWRTGSRTDGAGWRSSALYLRARSSICRCRFHAARPFGPRRLKIMLDERERARSTLLAERSSARTCASLLSPCSC